MRVNPGSHAHYPQYLAARLSRLSDDNQAPHDHGGSCGAETIDEFVNTHNNSTVCLQEEHVGRYCSARRLKNWPLYSRDPRNRTRLPATPPKNFN